MAKVGRKVQYERLTPVGIYLDEALRLANMNRAELARRAGMEASIITRVCNGERTVGRNTLLEWCSFVICPEWLETLFLNAAGYASREQEARAIQGAQAIVAEVLDKPFLEDSIVS
ncbi:MAG: helix-turn-helix transcriptional regulator [Chloroflexota bacterium]|nr:helix-turn-helix transcriptional regulator [Chloroflexota bacterium]